MIPLTAKKTEHQGIKVQLLGQIELASERGQPHDFVSLGRCLFTHSPCHACMGPADILVFHNLFVLPDPLPQTASLGTTAAAVHATLKNVYSLGCLMMMMMIRVIWRG